jgi:hypothetical protein
MTASPTRPPRRPMRWLLGLLTAPARLDEVHALLEGERIARAADHAARTRLVTEMAWDGGPGTMMAAVVEVLDRLRDAQGRVAHMTATADQFRDEARADAYRTAGAEIDRLTTRLAEMTIERNELAGLLSAVQADDPNRPPVDERGAAAGEVELGNLTASDHLMKDRPGSGWFTRQAAPRVGRQGQPGAINDQDEHAQTVAQVYEDGEEPAR